jgi:hypothetical protein
MRMKKLKLLFLVAVLSASSAMAQKAEQVVKIPLEQVPVAVRQSFEKDFGAIPEDGHWEALVVTTKSGGRTYAKPVWYGYSKRGASRAEKIEVRFSPEGSVTFFTGLKKSNGEQAVDPPAPAKKIG